MNGLIEKKRLWETRNAQIVLGVNWRSAILAYRRAQLMRILLPQMIIGTTSKPMPRDTQAKQVNVSWSPIPSIHGVSTKTIIVAMMLRTKAPTASASPRIWKR